MWPLVIVKLQVALKALPCFPRTAVVLQVNILVLDRPPQPLREHVVYRSSLAIHTDLDVRIQEKLNVLWTREVAPLVAVPDHRLGLSQGLLHGFHNESHF